MPLTWWSNVPAGYQSLVRTSMSGLPSLEVFERPFTSDEIVEAHADRRLIECFVSGTAVCSPLFTLLHTLPE